MRLLVIFIIVFSVFFISIIPVDNYLEKYVDDDNKFKKWWRKYFVYRVDDDIEI
jgi:hypothetical protein